MLKNLIVDLLLLAILVGGGCYGYKKGLLVIALRPARRIISILLSFLLCKPIGELLFAPAIAGLLKKVWITKGFTATIVTIISSVFAFLLILIISRFLLSILLSLLDSLLNKGIIGMLNKTLGLLLTLSISLMIAIVLVRIADVMNIAGISQSTGTIDKFVGGALYRFFLQAGK